MQMKTKFASQLLEYQNELKSLWWVWRYNILTDMTSATYVHFMYSV